MTPHTRHLGTACLLAAALACTVRADTVEARCEIYPKGSDKASAVLACSFSQRQGLVRIERSDGLSYELHPQGAGPGRYVDAQGKLATHQSGLGDLGHIYRLAQESVFVYWDMGPQSAKAEAPATQAQPTLLPPVPLAWSQTLQGVSFVLSSANDRSINDLKIVPSGLKRDNAPIVRQIEGQVTGVELADLNADGSPELYVFVRSAGSGSYGSLVAYSANRRLSLSEIALPALGDTPGADKGYMGHDEFAVVEDRLSRRFPIYRVGDVNAAPSGGVRQLRYKLVAGEASEAGWRLVVDRVVEY